MANPLTPSNPSSPIVVGFGSIPGGTGCTTLAAHTAAFAARLGLHTLGVSVDRNTDMLRRLGSDAEDIDGHWNSRKRLKLAHCPPDLLVEVGIDNIVEYLPNLGFGAMLANPELIIVDLGPAEASRLPISADFWVVPIMDSRSTRSLQEQTFPRGKSATLFLRTQVSFGTPHREEIIRLFNQQPADTTVRLMNTDLPRSGLLRQAEWECKTIWELGTPASVTRKRMDAFCNELLGIVATNLLEATHVRRAEAPLNAAQVNPNQAVPKEGTSGIRGDISIDKERDDDDMDTAPTLDELFRKQSAPKDSIDVLPDSIAPSQDDSSVVELVERMGSELRELRSDIQRLSTQVRIGAAYESVENLTRKLSGATMPKTARPRAVTAMSVRKKRKS